MSARGIPIEVRSDHSKRLWLAPGRDFGLFTVTNAADDPGENGTDAAAIVLIERFEAAFGS